MAWFLLSRICESVFAMITISYYTKDTGYEQEAEKLMSHISKAKKGTNLGKNNVRSKSVIQYDKKTNEIVGRYESANLAAKQFTESGGSNISSCCNGKLKTAYGFIWKFD